jgi:hypothetical protein
MEMVRTDKGAVLTVSNTELDVISSACYFYGETAVVNKEENDREEDVSESEEMAICIFNQIGKTETRSCSP